MSSHNAGTKRPKSLDSFVGEKVRLRRKQIGLSQEKLGDHLGITFQQVQKYEKGTNRIGASRLFDIARFLDVHVSYFFPAGVGSADAAKLQAIEGSHDPRAELIANFDRIRDRQTQDMIVDFVKVAAEKFRS